MTETEIILAARQGDSEAFAALIKQYEKSVFALTRRMCRNSEDAADAAQETFLAVWRGLSSFRGDARFSTWLYRLASNACIDILRREGRQRATLSLDDDTLSMEPADTVSPIQSLERAELRAEIERGLQALSPEYREVLILREIHQLSYEEIAQTLSIELGTVKSRISRGRKQLRDFLIRAGNFSGEKLSKESERKGCP